MHVSEPADAKAFRAAVRGFIDTHLDQRVRERVLSGLRTSKADAVAWHKALAKKGWIAPNWPKAWGGAEWDVTRQYIFEEEQALGGCPPLSPFAIKMVGPVIIQFGTEEQKKRFLPPSFHGDMEWCQGYSEPGSGSDLASLQTKAVRDGDVYVVNGQKIWTSFAHQADMMFALVRTAQEEIRQLGISVLLIDMKSKGISVSPIITIDGSHTLNQVIFEDVRVPAANLIGEPGKGWTYAKFLLGNERALIAQIPASTRVLHRLKAIAKTEQTGNGTLWDDADFRRKIHDVEIELEGLRVTNQRVLYEARSGTAGSGGAILKSKGTEISQRVSELLAEAAGHYASPWIREALYEGWNEPDAGPAYAKTALPLYMRQRANTIEGGTEEVQKNVIAKGVLGL